MTEIMAPAGNFERLSTAIKAGAHSVYFGVEQLNMRAVAAANFTVADLPEIVRITKAANIRTYLCVNTVMYDHDMLFMKKIIDGAKAAGVTAIIATDLSAIQYCKQAGIETHISTMVNVSNLETVKFFAAFADVIVLARELTLQQIKGIIDGIKNDNVRGPAGELVQIEIFAHGALCVAVSGKCFMSLGTHNSSANRGACVQNCRKSYRVIDEETGNELILENKHVMSPKDLCTIGFIDQLLGAGVKVLKLEGRGRSTEYVYTVTQCYREACEAVAAGTYTPEKIAAWTKRLEAVYNRGFWHGGYYLGKELGEWSGVSGSKATNEKFFLGSAKNYFSNKGIAQFVLETGTLSEGESILITGPTTGLIEVKAESIFVDGKPAKCAKKGDDITIPIPEKVRLADKLFVVRERVNA